ncbi:hypothetical protein DL546_008999 [Coniochaeta pulveracea]|uniref:Alpha-L-rhamnosidase C n=1 Tax=Coniochaeta pulveracea TaxID=177199 RepID=A0A420YJF5_9PEZI|nr:hypothetical protein DL546_008999 [Coniochaeta pulveracea]
MAEPPTQREPFPPLAPERQDSDSPSTGDRRPSDFSTRNRNASRSTLGGSIRKLSKQFEVSSPPEGFMSQTGHIASSVLSFEDTARSHRAQSAGKGPSSPLSPILSNAVAHSGSSAPDYQQESIPLQQLDTEAPDRGQTPTSDKTGPLKIEKTISGEPTIGEDAALTEPFENGYHFPPKYTKSETTKQGLVAFWKFITTWWGFFWFIYGLNVVAWGGMLFLLLCNAGPAMCNLPDGRHDCNDIDSPRRKWIEWDSQILNALFCVTGFGLAPWRFRDWYYLLKYRVLKQEDAWRRLAGLKHDWFRLEGSQNLPLNVGPNNIPDSVPLSSIPYPVEKIPAPPLTGVRAPPTAPWKMDFFIWCMIGNTFLQAVLSGFMWGMNRYDRPSWSTGLFVALACIIAAVGGFVGFLEGKKVKSIEGVPLTDQDRERLARDRELGIAHFNNIKDKKPKEKGTHAEANRKSRET